MGRRKNNPELVQELIDGLWSMDQNEFEKKYYSLSSSDMSKVSAAIDGMEDDLMSGRLDDKDEYYDDYDDSERISISDALDIWLSSGKDEDYTCGYSEYELEKELNRW